MSRRRSACIDRLSFDDSNAALGDRTPIEVR
jgi:hypothetical protein